MEGIIVNYRIGRHTQTTTHLVLQVKGSSSKEGAQKLIGKKATWKSPAGKEIKGEIKAPHGTKGAVRAIFEKGMPGQCLGQKVIIA